MGGACVAAAVVAGVVAYAVTPRAAAVIDKQPANRATTTVQKGVGAGLPELAAGKTAPGFSLPRLGGGAPVSLSADRGHPVVLNFFASWCSNCRAELSAFATVSKAPPAGIEFLGVDTNDHNPSKARSLLRTAGDHYPVGVDPNASVANGKYLVEALPVTVFITSRGRIAGEVFGTQSVHSLEPWLHKLETSQGSGK